MTKFLLREDWSLVGTEGWSSLGGESTRYVMRQIALLYLLNYCLVQVFLRHPIRRLASRLAMWGEPRIEAIYKPRGYVEGSWRQ